MESLGLYLHEWVAISGQSSVRLVNSRGEFIFEVLRPQIDSVSLGLPYSNITFSCCDWKSNCTSNFCG